MPIVDVYSKRSVHGDFGPSARRSLKESVRRFGARHFTVTADRVLSERSFSFKFHRPEDGDELTHNIIVRVRLDGGFEERRAKIRDNFWEELADTIATELVNHFLDRDITIGVEITLLGVGLFWGSASTRPILRRPGRAQISGEALFGD